MMPRDRSAPLRARTAGTTELASVNLYPSELNDLWRQRIRDAKRLRSSADNPNDASEMDIPLGLGWARVKQQMRSYYRSEDIMAARFVVRGGTGLDRALIHPWCAGKKLIRH
jgi:hypothetical protein